MKGSLLKKIIYIYISEYHLLQKYQQIPPGVSQEMQRYRKSERKEEKQKRKKKEGQKEKKERKSSVLFCAALI